MDVDAVNERETVLGVPVGLRHQGLQAGVVGVGDKHREEWDWYGANWGARIYGMPNLAEKIESLPPEIRRHAEQVIDDLVELSRYRHAKTRQSSDRTPEEWVRWSKEISHKVAALSKGGDAAEDVRSMRERA